LNFQSAICQLERQAELDYKHLEQMAKLKKRKEFIKDTKLELFLYKFQPHNFFELIF